MYHLLRLPNDLIQQIGEYLPARHLAPLIVSCRKLRDLLQTCLDLRKCDQALLGDPQKLYKVPQAEIILSNEHLILGEGICMNKAGSAADQNLKLEKIHHYQDSYDAISSPRMEPKIHGIQITSTDFVHLVSGDSGDAEIQLLSRIVRRSEKLVISMNSPSAPLKLLRALDAQESLDTLHIDCFLVHMQPLDFMNLRIRPRVFHITNAAPYSVQDLGKAILPISVRLQILDIRMRDPIPRNWQLTMLSDKETKQAVKSFDETLLLLARGRDFRHCSVDCSHLVINDKLRITIMTHHWKLLPEAKPEYGFDEEVFLDVPAARRCQPIECVE